MPERPTQAKANQRAADKQILSDCNPCPYAPDCRTHWIVDDAAETADCAHCYQTHTRAELARMLAGRA